MFLPCELALCLKLILKYVKSVPTSPFSPPCFDVPWQWIISELACYTYSMVVVPLYDTLGPGAIRYIINTGKNKINIILSETALLLGMVRFLLLSERKVSLTKCLEVTWRGFLGGRCAPHQVRAAPILPMPGCPQVRGELLQGSPLLHFLAFCLLNFLAHMVCNFGIFN